MHPAKLGLANILQILFEDRFPNACSMQGLLRPGLVLVCMDLVG